MTGKISASIESCEGISFRAMVIGMARNDAKALPNPRQARREDE